MQEILIRDNSLPNTYHRALMELYYRGEETECRDWNCKQKEVAMTMVVLEPLREPMISKLGIFGPRELEQYRQEMLDGILDFEVERGNWSYTYHQRMGEQVQFVINELKRNPSSRRAIILVRNEKDMGSDDPACLQHIQYFIRDGKLDCMVLFRSNDAVKATFMNAFALIMLQKRIADELGIEVGTYTHRANSFHCYERDYGVLEGYHKMYTEAGKAGKFGDMLSYRYEGEWEDLMKEYQSEIEDAVRRLKER